MTLTFGSVTGKSSDNTDVVEGQFVDLVPGRRIVQSFEFASEDPAFAGTMTMSWSLDPIPDGTTVTVVADDVPRGISRADHEAGMNSTLANLAAFVEQAICVAHNRVVENNSPLYRSAAHAVRLISSQELSQLSDIGNRFEVPNGLDQAVYTDEDGNMIIHTSEEETILVPTKDVPGLFPEQL